MSVSAPPLVRLVTKVTLLPTTPVRVKKFCPLSSSANGEEVPELSVKVTKPSSVASMLRISVLNESDSVSVENAYPSVAPRLAWPPEIVSDSSDVRPTIAE